MSREDLGKKVFDTHVLEKHMYICVIPVGVYETTSSDFKMHPRFLCSIVFSSSFGGWFVPPAIPSLASPAQCAAPLIG